MSQPLDHPIFPNRPENRGESMQISQENGENASDRRKATVRRENPRQRVISRAVLSTPQQSSLLDKVIQREITAPLSLSGSQRAACTGRQRAKII